MPVFKVYLNAKKVSTASVGDLGVLGAHVYWVRRKGEDTRTKHPDMVEEEMTLEVAGLITPTGEHVKWSQRPLKTGDEVCIKIVETAAVDEPTTRKRHDPVQDLRARKRYVRDMAKELGWTIKTKKHAAG